MPFKILAPRAVEEAYLRIKNHINRTEIVESAHLNEQLNHRIKFKLEVNQKVGSFKVRGVINALLKLKEQKALPSEIVTFSSGNHGCAVAWACQNLNIKATIYLSQDTDQFKQQLLRDLGANLIITNSRQVAEDLTYQHTLKGAYELPPSNHDQIIAGNGTACYEALQEMISPAAIFASCGGGGLVAGSYLASRMFNPISKIFAAEPLIANDVARSLRANTIYRFKNSPKTIADGARTLGITERLFYYLKRIEGIFEISEAEIIFWAKYLSNLLKINCEPTAAISMAAAYQWLKNQPTRKEVLVILSGGNTQSASISTKEFKQLEQQLLTRQLS